MSTALKPKMKIKSRGDRWRDAAARCVDALAAAEDALSALEDASSDLKGVQEEYEEWKDNLPENLQSSALGEKLEEVCNLDIEDQHQCVLDAIQEAREKYEEAAEIDLPLGFGRD